LVIRGPRAIASNRGASRIGLVTAALLVLLALASEDLALGRRLFDVHCARCHGIGGTGGEGPSLARPTLPRAPDDAALENVIRNGIPGTEMPRTLRMLEREFGPLVAYVRSLGSVPVVDVPGDRENGRELFEGKGTCSICHIVSGEGEGVGPDLSDVGSRRGPDHLKASMLDPESTVSPRYLVVSARTAEGLEVRGMRVNEDPFTIQIRDLSGALHSFDKLMLAEIRKEPGESLMPSFRGRLSPSEIDDLVAYLARLRGKP
jgi:putative heme-binding domain-containing protein